MAGSCPKCCHSVGCPGTKGWLGRVGDISAISKLLQGFRNVFGHDCLGGWRITTQGIAGLDKLRQRVIQTFMKLEQTNGEKSCLSVDAAPKKVS